MEAKCHIARDEIAIDGVFRRDWNLEWPPHAAATVCAAWEARKRSLTHSLSLSLCPKIISVPPFFLLLLCSSSNSSGESMPFYRICSLRFGKQ